MAVTEEIPLELVNIPLDPMGPLLILCIVLLAGSAGGWVARRLHVPSFTGNIVAGVILSFTLLHGLNVAHALQSLSAFAIGLIAVTAGGHFSYRRIHNALRRIMFISIFESLMAVVVVFFTLRLIGQDWKVSLLLGCLAASTAPATTVALISENHAKGPFVKTLLGAVSIDSIICILLFAFVHSLLGGLYEHGEVALSFNEGVKQTLWQLLGSGSFALLLGVSTSKLFDHHRFHDFSVLLVSILLAVGFSQYVHFSPLLTCLFFGAFLGNTSRHNELQLRALDPIEPLLYTAFFTLAGTAAHLDLLISAGILCVLYVLARMLGKGVGAWLGAILSHSSKRIRKSIPWGFVPQAGVALGLVVILQGDDQIPEDVSSLIGTIVLAAVTINEIIGPFFTRAALRKSKEAGLDRPRLIEFLDEEYILPNLKAKDKWEALEKLVNFYAATHKISKTERAHVLETVIQREKEAPTGIGQGGAIPHGRVNSGTDIQGVMAICPDGIAYDSPDDQPVRLLILIVTPKDHEKRHLEVLASLSLMLSNSAIRSRLITAIDANDAWEVVESKESRSFNYFLEMAEDEIGKRI